MKKLVSLCVATAAFAFASLGLHAAFVGEETAEAAAEGFLARSSVAQRILPGRSVNELESRGNLWIAKLDPSGFVLLAGSDKCAPVLFFSPGDFAEPDVGSPFAAKLTGDEAWVAEKEADESAGVHPDWAKYTAPVATKRRLLGTAPTGTTSVVGPLMNCGWGQGAPFNDLSPLSSLCGCMATAAGQEHRYWRWPYRYEKSRQGNHGLRNSLGEYSEHILRPDGRVPFNYDKIVAYAPNPSSTPSATDKEATYQTAWLSLWMQSLTGMSYKPGASGGTQKLCNFAEDYWFEKGPVMSYWRDGYTNLWNAIKADLDFGSPIQVNSPGHQMVVDGYAIENEGTAGEVDYVNINYGWGSPEGWVNLLTAVTENTSGGRLADFQIGYRPQKIVQFEPVPKVCTSDVTLKWHLPPCYTNRTTGFAVEIAKDGGEPTVYNVATHEETTTYTATGLANGSTYTFTVIPLMSDGSEARANSVTTTIGTPKAAPEILGVSSVACGIELMQQGLFVECGRGMVNTIAVTCSESVTRLEAYSSHLTVLPDNKVSCVDNGSGSWTVNIDATSMSKDWDGDMLILTLVAANADGTEAYKNLMLRFNSMRNVLGGTFEIVETSVTSPVWFAGGSTTTLDAKGQAVTFASGAVNGTGTITLTDSVGNGSFTFQGLDGFTGTLKWAPSVAVNLPSDMSGFAGTLYFNSPAGNYTLSSDLPSTAKIYIGNNTQLTPGNVTINAAVTGNGILNIAGVNATFNNLKDFKGSVSLGSQESAGTLTLKAGEEKNVEIWNGTLYLTLDKAQVAYGYSTSQITELESFFGAKLVFQDENGKVLQTWTSSLSEYAITASANTWFPDSYGTGSFSDAGRWSQGLPSAGDYVIFNDSFGDSQMTLDLSSDLNLGYVKVVGTKFNIKAAEGTATLTVDTLENTVQTKIQTAKFLPATVIPRAKLFVASGITLDCEIDHSIANNIRDPNDLEGLYWESCWHGTVVFTDYADTTNEGLDLTFWGNNNSTIRLNGFSGRLTANKTIPYTVELVDSGTSPALHWSTGTKGATSTFEALTGDGIFKTSGGTTENVLLKDVSGFTGQFQLAAKTVAIASTIPTAYTGDNGKLHVCQSATIAPGAIWNIGGGVYFGSGCNLDIYGQLWSLTAAMTTYGEGAVVTLEDGAVIRMALAMSGDYAPTLDFKAGTYQFEGNLTETKTVNFCAAAGKYTTLDANGHTVTLGANFFSGSGDVYLKTSTSGGAFVIQGIPASYTGTIYVDNSIGLTISGDISQMGGKLNISDITLSRNSSNIGKIDVCSGATLQVVLTDDEAMEGLTVTGVTLNGGTIEFVDQRGTVVGSSTESLVYVKPEDYTVPSPEPTAIWYGDFSSSALTQFAGYTIDDWNETHGANMSSVTIDRNNQGLLVDFASAKGYFTVLVKYSGLSASSSGKRVLFATTANSDKTRDRCGIRLLTDSKVQGLWNDKTDANNDADYGSASTGTAPSAGTLAFVYDRGASGTSAYVAGVDESLPSTALWNNTGLKAGDAYGFAVGGMCRDAAVSGVEAAKGMTITGLAIFDRVLTTSELKYFRWPDEEEDPEVPEITYEVSPASGAVAAGTKMTVTCSDPDATIWYKSLTDADYTEYTEPVALATGINYYYVKVNDGEATLYTYVVSAPTPAEPEIPVPTAVWVSGQFTESHNGYSFRYIDQKINDSNNIEIGKGSKYTNFGAVIEIPSSANCTKASLLVKCKVSGGAPDSNSILAGFSYKDVTGTLGALCKSKGDTSVSGFYTESSKIKYPDTSFGEKSLKVPEGEFYMLLSCYSPTEGTYGTKFYIGSSLDNLTGGAIENLQFAYQTISSLCIGGPVDSGNLNCWTDMEIEAVALFVDKWYSGEDVANYEFPAPAYDGPDPVAVWVAGEFGDDRSAHGGLEFSLNGNTTNALGQIVIGDSTTLGATVAIPEGHSKASVLVKYSIPEGAHANDSVLASMFSLYDLGALSDSGESVAKGYWFNGSAVSDGSYAFGSSAPSIPQEGYLLLSYKHDSSTAAYLGETIATLAGGSSSSLHFSNNDVTKMAFGGPTVAGAKPWPGMVIESVAIFLDEYLSNSDLANYKFPEQGAVQPVDTDRYIVDPVASWVNDFKTTTKGDYTLSVSGTTAAKDDTFGGTLTIGDAAAVIDTTAANSANMTVLIKYRAASSVTTAPVVAFGGMSAVGLDVGVYTKSDKTLAVYRNFSTDNGKPYDFATAPTLSANGGYVLCARDNGQQCMAYVGDSLDAMTGGTVSHANIKFSNVPLTKLGIGGNSGIAANANDMVPFTGFVVEKVVVFNGYYTPDQIRYIPNPEEGDTVNIASGATWNFAAGETRTYTNIGTLSSGGTIAITNAATLVEGTYKLAEWTTPQQYTTQCAGYGKVGNLVTDGLAAGLSARLVYGARAIYLRVDDKAKQAARKPLVVWCYGDSITEGYNAQATGANYRILLYQKLEMLGYNVRSTGVYGLSNGFNSVDPSGTPLTDQYRWHSAKHGATAAPSSLSHRSNLSENVDTLAIQAGTPDVALLLIGVNDLPQFSTVEPVFAAWTNIITRLVNNLPDTKIIASTILYSDGSRTDIDPKITQINSEYIKPLIADMPEAWKGHVVLADLNSIVKSGQPGIIYSDHLHPDWWGYDQMADGYLEKIVECYPNPDATDFPSQNPIPDAPTADQLGAANKPELADYRAGFTKLCNIRVEKGQDVSNVVYDDVNSAAASDNLEKVGYFVEFVRDDNHAHKWVWVDMDAFGDKDLASIGLPQRIYQQAVTKMHVCSNHGAIDNVAADDDSVTGWIEFSPYNYDRAGSNSAAPANYGDPFDWNDTLSTSGSYGCMQVFRVMNPSSRDLYERPQLMFAFNNFQSQNSNPADFGIGNFAQHFNCNNSYHTEDWTGVGGTLAKMAPDAYSVKTIEIWTKEMPYEGPEPVAVWIAGEFDDDRSAHGGCEFALNDNTIDENGNIVIGDSTTLGATATLPAATYQKVTMLVQYSLPSGGAPAANSVPASLFSTYDLGARAAQAASSTLDGYWYNGSSVQAGTFSFSDPAQTIPQDGYILISTWATDTNPDDHGTAVYTGAKPWSLSGGEKTGLRFTGADRYITSVGVGGPTVAGAVPWAGMVIKNVAIFGDWVTPADIANYKFPEQGAVRPVDPDRYTIEPVASWVNDFKTTTKGDYTLSVSGTTAAKDDTFGGTLTVGDAAATIDVSNGANGGNVTVLVKYRATPTTVNAPVITFGETLTKYNVKIDVGAYTQSARTLAVNRSYSGGNNQWVALNTAVSLNEGEGYLLCARKYNDMMVYVGNSLDSMTGGATAAPGDISYSCDLIQAIGIGGPSGLPNADSTWSPFTGFVVEKVVVFNGYYTPDQICYVENPEDGDTVNIADNTTWTFTASDTPREYTNIGTLSSSGTIAIANASALTEGVYPLATWTTAQKKSTGYGHVGNLDVTGLPAELSAELVYGAKAIYLRVWNQATQAARGTLKVWPYGDSITEGFNAGGTRANYRALLAQKLSMLGFNVEMVGCYDKINGADVIDPAGQVVPDAWKWHSAKHGATAGPTTSATGRANLCENVDTLSAQVGNPDVVLLLAGANDIVPATGLSAAQVVLSITNIVAHLAANLPNSKIVVGNQINVESGYNSGNYNHVVSMIPQVNALLKTYVDNLPEELVGRVFLADLNSYVKSGEYGILFDHGSDHLHPDWWGHDQMAEGWLSVITNKFTATQVFPSATVPAAPTADELGAAAKDELAGYRKGFKLARRIDAASNLNTADPYAATGTGATEGIEKVGYFVEYVRADNNAHRWVWVDMDAFGTTIDALGLPVASHQQVVTKLHVKSNHNGIDDVAANDDSVSGFIEFSPFDYNGNVSGVSGAPAGNASCCDWNDTLSTSGSYGCMQVHRVFSPAKSAADGVARGGQVLFAYNNWQSSSSTAEFGIGNFSSHFYRGANDAQTLDYTYTANATKMNAAAYSVKRIEIWTKGAGGDEPEEKTTSTENGAYPVPYSWFSIYAPGITDDYVEQFAKMKASNGQNTWWQCYVLGLDPTNETSKFVVTIRMEGTKPVIEYDPTNEELVNQDKIEYILQGSSTLKKSNEWTDADDRNNMEPRETDRFFRVKVQWGGM